MTEGEAPHGAWSLDAPLAQPKPSYSSHHRFFAPRSSSAPGHMEACHPRPTFPASTLTRTRSRTRTRTQPPTLILILSQTKPNPNPTPTPTPNPVQAAALCWLSDPAYLAVAFDGIGRNRTLTPTLTLTLTLTLINPQAKIRISY